MAWPSQVVSELKVKFLGTKLFLSGFRAKSLKLLKLLEHSALTCSNPRLAQVVAEKKGLKA